jgi:CheY-like chemotaxis protein
MAKEILIANSNKADREEFQRIFKATDYRLVFSESGEEALLRVRLFKPDLIIAASGLSEKNGLELCEDIKADVESKHIPFILLSNIFGEISEKDSQRVQADGIISKPLHEIEVLNLVQRLIEEEAVMKNGKGILEEEEKQKFFTNIERSNPIKQKDLSLDEPEEDQIIELVDIVEETEPKMSIDDFVHPEKEEPPLDLAPFESWDRIEEMVKPEERVSLRKFKPPVTGFKLSPEEEDEVETEEMLLQLEKEISSEETPKKEMEFFEKIELEEILEKVEQLKPSIEKEWPAEKIVPLERERTPIKEAKAVEEVPPVSGKVADQFPGLDEFEASLRTEVKSEALKEEIQPFVAKVVEAPKEVVKAVKREALEEEVQPFVIEEPKMEVPKEAVSQMQPEALAEKEIQRFDFGDLGVEAPKEALTEELIEEEVEIEELAEEEFPEELFEVLGEEEVGVVREPVEMTPKEISPKEIEIAEKMAEEIRLKEIVAEKIPLEEVKPEVIRPGEKEVTPKEISLEEIGIAERVPKEIRIEAIAPEEMPAEEVRPKEIRIEKFEEPEAQRMFEEKIGPTLRKVDKQVEKVVEKGVREMMEGFLTKLVPEMTENIIGLTLDRIEKMVKEIVPDLAEKAIQEEIKRLQKGEKD